MRFSALFGEMLCQTRRMSQMISRHFCLDEVIFSESAIRRGSKRSGRQLLSNEGTFRQSTISSQRDDRKGLTKALLRAITTKLAQVSCKERTQTSSYMRSET